MSSVINDLDKKLHSTSSVLLAYSGGLDSTVLLHQLIQLRTKRRFFQIRAVHIHHNISPMADSWVFHCQQQCNQLHVKLEIIKVIINTKHGGIEAGARCARYQALSNMLMDGEVLLTAHHIDDQSETLLLALKRGSGPAGLAGMQEDRILNNGKRHLRPLLYQKRKQLESWANQHDLVWIEDDSNKDVRYDRNFLRIKVMTLLNDRWPNFASSVSRSATMCRRQEKLLDELMAQSLQSLQDYSGSLAIIPLFNMSELQRWGILRRWIKSHNGIMPSCNSLQHLWQNVICSRNDAAPCLRFGNNEVRRFRKRIYWLKVWKTLENKILLWSSPWKPLFLPEDLGYLKIDVIDKGDKGDKGDKYGILLRKPKKDEVVSIRFTAQGSYHIVGRAGSRRLKKLWQEFHVPPWIRKRTPLIFYNEILVAAANLFVTNFGNSSGGLSWQVHWISSLKNKQD